MQSEAARRAGDPSHQSEDPPPEGLGGHDLLTQADAGCPQALDGQPGAVSPRPEDVEYSRRVLEAWDQAEASGRGSTSLDGRMVDMPVVKRARNLLALAEAVAQRN